MGKKKEKSKTCFGDICVGDVIEFYDKGFRYAIVERFIKKRKIKKGNTHDIVTDRYGKVPITSVLQVYNYDGERTTKKTLMDDIFE